MLVPSNAEPSMYPSGYNSSRPMLTLYDIHRRPRRVPSGRWHCSSSIQQVWHAFRCVICWSTLRNPKLVRECLHRFCEDCIEKSLRMGRNECPVCRVFVPSKRNLASDEGCEVLIENVLGPTLRTEEVDEALLKDAAAASAAVSADAAAGRGAGSEDDAGQQQQEEEQYHGDNEDGAVSSPRLLRHRRRVKAVYTEPPKKKRKSAEKGGTDDDDDDAQEHDDDDEEDDTPPLLIEFYLCPHRNEHHLEKLLLPYIRLSGDATVATLIKFIQAKLSTDKPIHLMTSVASRSLHETTPLRLVANVTQTLYYRLDPKKTSSSSSGHAKQTTATKGASARSKTAVKAAT